MLLPNRHGNSGNYRYGFNGKEMDNEIKGEGVQYDYGFRIYDSRVARFLSLDPLFKSFPYYTPYQFAGNKPIVALDLDGLEELDYRILNNLNYGDITISMVDAPEVYKLNGKRFYTTLNALGEKRNAQWYFSEALKKAPDWWSADNAARIGRGEVPIADDVFLKKIGRNLNLEDYTEFAKVSKSYFLKKKSGPIPALEHHHLDHTDDVIALPWKVHRGKGNTKYWHRFGKALKAGKKLGKKLPLVGAIISVVEVSAGNVDPVSSGIGLDPLFDPISENVQIFGDILRDEGLASAVNAFSQDDRFSILYTTLEQTKNIMNGGALPDDAWYVNELRSVHEMDYYGDGILPHMIIFYNGEIILITNTPQDPNTYEGEEFDKN